MRADHCALHAGSRITTEAKVRCARTHSRCPHARLMADAAPKARHSPHRWKCAQCAASWSPPWRERDVEDETSPTTNAVTNTPAAQDCLWHRHDLQGARRRCRSGSCAPYVPQSQSSGLTRAQRQLERLPHSLRLARRLLRPPPRLDLPCAPDARGGGTHRFI